MVIWQYYGVVIWSEYGGKARLSSGDLGNSQWELIVCKWPLECNVCTFILQMRVKEPAIHRY